MKLSLILPCYNEEKNVLRIEKELISILDHNNYDYELICIDDGSKDKTFEELMKLKKKHKSIVVIKHGINKGLGAAVRTGIRHATGNLTVTLDADFTFHPKLIPNLIERFNKGDVDCVIGSPSLAGYDKDIPYYRVFLSNSCNTIYSMLLGQKITAVSPIFRLYKTKDIKKIQDNLESTGFDINSEILFRLLANKKRVTEIPAALTQRIYGESKINNLKEIKNHLKMFMKIIKWKIKK